MWILMTETYVGNHGTFPKGQKFDLPPDIVKQLPKGCCKPCRAPWDAQKDVKACKLAQARLQAREWQIWADLKADEANELAQRADQLVPVVAEKQKKAKEAEKAALAARAKAEKKGAGKNAKKHVFGLARDAEKKGLEFQKAHAELQVLTAEKGLKQLEADDAKRKAEQFARAAGPPAEKEGGNAVAK